MMQALREKMKLVMLLTLGAFLATIIFSWGAGGFKNRGKIENGIIGVIDGQKVQYQYFSQLYSQQLEAYRQNYPDQDFPEFQLAAVRDQLWNGLVTEVLKAKAIERLGLQATNEEIYHVLRNNPPAYLRQVEQFQTNGQFDMAKYQAALSDERNFQNWIPVENQLRQTIPNQKLRNYVTGNIQVSDAEVRDAFRRQNEMVKARLVFFDPNAQSMENVTVSDSDIEKYFNEHKEDYRQDEQRKINYIKLVVTPSSEDSAQVLEDVKYIMERLEDGDDFGELAAQFSKDPGSKDNNGDLGFFSKDGMEAPFAEAAFATSPGKVTGPVKTVHGLHIIKVLGTKREDGEKKVHAQHILLKHEVSSETRDALYDKANYIYEQCQENEKADFETLAAQENLTVTPSPLFSKGSFIPGLGMATRVVNLAFREKAGYLSPPVYAGDNIVVFKLAEIKKSHIKSLESVKNNIKRILERDQKKSKARYASEEFAKLLAGGATMDEAAAQDSLQIIDTDFFTIEGNIPRIGRDDVVNGKAFALEAGQTSDPVHTDRGSYIIQVTDKKAMDEAAFQAGLKAQKQQMLSQKQNAAWMAYLNSLREGVEIKDYREYYY